MLFALEREYLLKRFLLFRRQIDLYLSAGRKIRLNETVMRRRPQGAGRGQQSAQPQGGAGDRHCRLRNHRAVRGTAGHALAAGDE